MLLLVSVALATTAIYDDFEDGVMTAWRPSNGQWLENGGELSGLQTTAGPGMLTLAGYNSLKERVTFTTHPAGTGTPGIIYASSTTGDWCGVFYGQGDVWVGNSDGGEVLVLDGEDPGTDPTFVVTVDRDTTWVTIDGVDVWTGDTDCSISRISGDVGVAGLSTGGAVAFLDFDFQSGGRDRDGDGAEDSVDCAPDDPTVYPDATETWYDGVDQNCDGRNDNDRDGDGVEHDTDCDDTDPYVYPGAQDLWYDGKDEDCAGNDDYDADGDGHQFDGVGGDDCDDGDETTYPGAPTDEHDGVDHDCDGFIPAPGSDDSGEVDSGPAPDTGSNSSTDPGCGCDSGGSGALGGGLGLALAALTVRRRR